MRYFAYLLPLTILSSAAFGQLSSVQKTFTIESVELLQDSVISHMDQLILHVQPDDFNDVSSISVNLYSDDIPLIDEIRMDLSELLPFQNTTEPISIPLIVYEPGKTYLITVSCQNILGEYIPTAASYYPNN